MPLITKAKSYKARMNHLIKHALKTRRLGDFSDTIEISTGEDTVSFKIYGREITITYWITKLTNGGTQYEYVVSDGLCWINGRD